ncbi:MAG: hypothetical protein ACOC5A_00915 [Halanaerobiales bacterium]
MHKKALCVVLIIIFILFSASCSGPGEVNRGFYYWRSNLTLEEEESSALEELEVDKLYLKFFDVVRENDKTIPRAELSVDKKINIPDGVQVLPTVYITNQTLKVMKRDDLPHLAENIYRQVEYILQAHELEKPGELQIDCDWTEGTRTKYFILLEQLREIMAEDQLLTATIRLHQVKYSERTGVPPVDRGVLMYYNLGRPGNPGEENSILNFEEGAQYLENLHKYELPLDIALPIYSWGALFQGNNFKGLINNLTREELEENPDIVSVDGNTYRAEANTYVGETNIFRNERIRIEESKYGEVIRAAEYVAQRLDNEETNVILFHLDKNLLERFDDEKLNDIYDSFD